MRFKMIIESKETDKLYKAISDTADAIDDLDDKDEKSAKKNLDSADDKISDVKDNLKESLSEDPNEIYNILHSNLEKMMFISPKIQQYGNGFEFHVDNYFSKNILVSTIKNWLKECGINPKNVQISREKHFSGWNYNERADGYDYYVTINSDNLKEGTSKLELIKLNKQKYDDLSSKLDKMSELEREVAEKLILPWIKGNNWVGGLSDSAAQKAYEAIMKLGYDFDDIEKEEYKQMKLYESALNEWYVGEPEYVTIEKSPKEADSDVWHKEYGYGKIIGETDSNYRAKFGDRIRIFAKDAFEKGYIKKVESLTEDIYQQCKDDAENISSYLNKNAPNLWWDLIDYDMFPMNTSKVSIEIEGDWKHDHQFFKNLIRDWATENNRPIFKIDEREVGNSESDDYTADYDIYITADKDSFDKLNSMRRLFGESLKESLSEDVGVASLFNDLIQREYELLSEYESAQVTLEEHSVATFDDIFDYIKDDINIHIGMLEAALEDINPSSEKTEEGKEQGETLLLDESLFE